MYYYRCAFLLLVALVMMPLSVSAACRSDFPGYIGQLHNGKNEQVEDKIATVKSLYINTICGSPGVNVFVEKPNNTFQIFGSGATEWSCETNLNMFIFRTDPNTTFLIYDFPSQGGDVVVSGCHTTAF